MADSVKLDRVPPQDINAERALIGAMLMPEENEMSIPKAVEIIGNKEIFYAVKHQKIYDAILALFNDNKPVDLVTLTAELEARGELDHAGGVPELDEIWNSSPSAANVEYYCRIVLDSYSRRKLIRATAQANDECYDSTFEPKEIIKSIETDILRIQEQSQKSKVVSSKDLVIETMESITEAAQHGGLRGIPTGFEALDEKTGGVSKKDMGVIAGRPSMGKSMFVQNIAQNVAKQGSTVLFFSLETSREQLMTRILSNESRISLFSLLTGNIKSTDSPEHNDYVKLARAANIIAEMPLFIDDTAGITLLELAAKSRQIKIKHGLDMIIVDYMQLARTVDKYENRQVTVSMISSGLKQIAKELDVAMIAVSQLSRRPESRPGNRPELSDLRESGNIEQDADLVLLMYRRQYYEKDYPDGSTEVIIAKQRNGPIGNFSLYTEPETMRFGTIAKNYTEA